MSLYYRERFSTILEDEHFACRRIHLRRVFEVDEASIFVIKIVLCDPTGRCAAPSNMNRNFVLYDLGKCLFQRRSPYGYNRVYDAVSHENNGITTQGNRGFIATFFIGNGLEKRKTRTSWIL
jgi:hypothetical protein